MPGAGGRDLSTVMETLIDQAESAVRVAQQPVPMRTVGFGWEPPNQFWPLGEPAGRRPHFVMLSRKTLAGDAPTNGPGQEIEVDIFSGSSVAQLRCHCC